MEASQNAGLFCAVDRFKQSPIGKRLVAFLMGIGYPIVVAALVAVGHIFSVDFFTNILNFVLISLALVLCDTLKPAFMFAISFIYQISVKYAPGVPTFSDYYYTGWRLPVLCVLVLMLAFGIFYFLFANRCFEGFGFKTVPMLLPICALSVAFLLNGAFSGVWILSDFLHGVLQVLIFGVLFLLFYLGLRRERGDELVSRFIFVSMLLAIVLILDVVNVYITRDVIVDGEAVKDKIFFGWGIWNTVGASLAVLIPVCFLGVMRSKWSALYFVVATLSFLAICMSLSRNALLFGGLAYALCAVASCFIGLYKKVYRIIVIFGALAVIAFGILFWDKIAELLSDFLERGFSDNGRYELWKTGIENFLKAPVFGSGFFEFVSDTFVSATFFPKLAHNTIIQLLSSMGVFGLLAYSYYRASSFVPFIKLPTVEKSMLLGSIIVVLLMSLFDNLILRFLHVVHYDIALAIGFIIYEQQCKKESESLTLV